MHKPKQIQEQAKEIYSYVDCGYLKLHSGEMIVRGRVRHIDLLVECHNLECGPQHGCNFLDHHRCSHRSAKVDYRKLYREKKP